MDDDGIIGSLQRSAMNWPSPGFPANDEEATRIVGDPDLIPSVYLPVSYTHLRAHET